MARVFEPVKRDTKPQHEARDIPRVLDTTRPIRRIFFGDSHLERLLWVAAMQPIKAKYIQDTDVIFAVGGDRVQHVLWRVENVLKHWEKRTDTPSEIVLMAGGNNFALDRARNQKSMVDRVTATIIHTALMLRRRFPQSNVTIWAVPMNPTNASVLHEYAAELEAACGVAKIPFNNTPYAASVNATGLWEDDVHLNATGYETCIVPCLQ